MMATRPTRPKGYLTKGKVTSPVAARKAAARQQLTTPRGLAGIVINSVLDGTPAGRGARTARASSKVMLAVRANMRKKAAGVGQRKAVSSVAARKVAEKAKFAPAGIQRGGKAKAGTRPMSTQSGSPRKNKGPNQPVARPGKTDTKTINKSYQNVRRTPSDVIRERATERNQRVRTALTPLKPRGTKSSGTKGAGRDLPKNKADIIDKPSGKMKAIGARQPRFVGQEVQHLTKPEIAAQREADRRVTQGLRDIKKAERVKRKAN
jgi:hypothetical protein